MATIRTAFVSENELNDHGYALASTVKVNANLVQFINIDDTIKFLQQQCNICAEELIKYKNDTEIANPDGTSIELGSQWRAYHFIISELERLRNK